MAALELALLYAIYTHVLVHSQGTHERHFQLVKPAHPNTCSGTGEKPDGCPPHFRVFSAQSAVQAEAQLSRVFCIRRTTDQNDQSLGLRLNVYNTTCWNCSALASLLLGHVGIHYHSLLASLGHRFITFAALLKPKILSLSAY